MGSGFSKLKKQQKLIAQQMSQWQEELKTKQFVASAGNGLVTVTIDGEKALKSIQIKPECVDPQDVEGLQDLIMAAFASAHAEASQMEAETTQSLSFPGL